MRHFTHGLQLRATRSTADASRTEVLQSKISICYQRSDFYSIGTVLGVRQRYLVGSQSFEIVSSRRRVQQDRQASVRRRTSSRTQPGRTHRYATSRNFTHGGRSYADRAIWRMRWYISMVLSFRSGFYIFLLQDVAYRDLPDLRDHRANRENLVNPAHQELPVYPVILLMHPAKAGVRRRANRARLDRPVPMVLRDLRVCNMYIRLVVYFAFVTSVFHRPYSSFSPFSNEYNLGCI